MKKISDAAYVRYKKDVAFIESLFNAGGGQLVPREKMPSPKKFLASMYNLLEILGNPQKDMNIIHVGGTNGKGSTTRLCHTLLQEAGYTVGSTMSPATTTTIERILVNDHLISPAELHTLIEKSIKPALYTYVQRYKTTMPSFLQVMLAISLLYFKQKKCDWVVLEVGMGGLYDWTNVIERPKATIITNIGLDHMQFLGNTKKQIAFRKAGIIKQGAHVITGERSPKLKAYFKKVAGERGAHFHPLQTEAAKTFAHLPFFTSPGQQQNLAVVLTTLDTLGISLSEAKLKKVITHFHMSARQEVVHKNPTVMIDGAHNSDKLENLAKAVTKMKYRKLHLIFGIADNKKYAKGLKALSKLSSYIYTTRAQSAIRLTRDVRTLAREAQKANPKAKLGMYLDSSQALATALKNAHKDDLILVTGSFFLAGELRSQFISEKTILSKRKVR